MNRLILNTLTVGFIIWSSAGFVSAADEKFDYGRNLMTEQERAEHRERIRNLQPQEERNAYRMRTHEEMRKRAKERGIRLPREPGQRARSQDYPALGYSPGQGRGGSRGGGGRGR